MDAVKDIGRDVEAAGAYDAVRDRSQRRQRELAAAGRRVVIPKCGNLERRAACECDLKRFLSEYFPATFYLPWCPDHLRIIADLESTILAGGLKALAMPRGHGKTVIIEGAAIWGTSYGHRPFIPVVGPDEDHAKDRIKNVKTEFEYNDRLNADFPEICAPIRALEGINQRRLLTEDGRQIRMEFTATRIVLPNIPGSLAAGAVIATAGITGQIRGLNFRRTDGTVIRPSLVIIDDPQTRESASSPAQCAQRERIINGDILGLAGPGVTISAVMPCTVIRRDDLADRLLDRKRNPQWRGERTKLVYQWPKREDLWQRYLEILRECWSKDLPTDAATEFYRANRAAMDEGAVVAWPEKFDPGELSAIQNAWNLRAKLGDAAFFAEYQNDPVPEEAEDASLLTSDQIATKTNGVPRGVVPLKASHLTAFIDVHDTVLFWAVVAWSDDFTGWVVAYGTYPDQRARVFSLRKPTRTMTDEFPKVGQEGVIRAGLVALTALLLAREWRREDGAVIRIDRCLVDSGYKPGIVQEFCRTSAHAGVLLPSRGMPVGAKNKPFSEYQQRPGERHGDNWLIKRMPHRASQRVSFDANHWKSFLQARLASAVGDPGGLSLHGKKADEHRLLAEHLVAERPKRVTANGRTVDEWEPIGENHWLDCIVGCAVAGSMVGAKLTTTRERTKKRTSFAKKYAAFRAGRQ